MKVAKVLPRLRHPADYRTLVFFAITLLVLAGNWSGFFRNPVTIVFAPLACFIGSIITHNHMHLPVFRGRGWNSVFQVLLTFAFGQPPTGIITAHNERHHGYLETEHDFVRSSLAPFRWNALNLLTFPFFSIAAMYREKPGDLANWKRKRPRLFRQAVLERAVFYSAIVAVLILDFRATIFFLILPWVLAQLALVGLNFLQHQDCEARSELDHSRNVTGKFMNWLLLNNGYHTAHHLRPALHWSELSVWHQRHLASRMDSSLNHRTLTGLIFSRLSRTPPPHAR